MNKREIIKALSQKYDKVQQIGSGGSSTTFSAQINKQKRALKVLTLEQYDPSLRSEIHQRLEKEVEYLKMIESPYVVRVYDHYYIRDMLVIEQELINMGDVLQYIHRSVGSSPFSKQDIILLCYQVLQGLRQLHKNHLIHRDIKCQNILVDFQNVNKKRFVICDLGLAKKLDFTDQEAQTRIGTLRYASPQTILGQPYSNKIDVWSLGVCLFMLTTKIYPFDKPKQIVDDEPQLSLVEDLQLRELIGMMLEKKEADRPSVDDLLILDIFVNLE